VADVPDGYGAAPVVAIGPPTDYEWDIFLSFADDSFSGDWVKYTFRRLLEELMATEGHRPSIFFYREQDYAVAWQQNLMRALTTSRLMVCVWSPDYFRSKWCQLELRAMLRREKQLGMPTVAVPQGLVYGIRYSDGKHFGPEAHDRIWLDAERWNNPRRQFCDTMAWDGLFEATKPFARNLVERLMNAVPAWDTSFVMSLDDDADDAGGLAGGPGDDEGVPIPGYSL
jgi:hypothetical protein